jgi:hypothetical protein
MAIKIKIESNADFLIFTKHAGLSDSTTKEACVALNKKAEDAAFDAYAQDPTMDGSSGVGCLRSDLGLTLYMFKSDRKEFMRRHGFTVEYSFI